MADSARRPHRTTAPLPAGTVVVRPLRWWSSSDAPIRWPITRRYRAVCAVTTAVILVVGVGAIVVTRPALLVWVVSVALIAIGVLVGVAQPGTLLYATSDHVGHRTMLRTRYELPRSMVAGIEVAYLSIEGSPLKTIAFVDQEGRQVLRSYSANYDAGDLERFAGNTALDFRP